MQRYAKTIKWVTIRVIDVEIFKGKPRATFHKIDISLSDLHTIIMCNTYFYDLFNSFRNW